MQDKRQIALCVMLAVALHAAALIGWHAQRPMRMAVGRRAITPRHVQVLSISSVPANSALAHNAAPRPMMPPVPSAPPVRSEPPAPPAAQITPEPPASLSPPATPTVAPSQDTVDTPAVSVDTASLTPAAQDGYIPSALLSVVPQVLTPVSIPMPPALATQTFSPAQRVVLRLYIDEAGQVDYVETESSSLPPSQSQALEQAAHAAFMSARFAPGEMRGHPVKSTIRIEVKPESGAP
jgi:hypothetical protein